MVGRADRNRAVHGDEVVVEILPKSQWKVRSLAVKMDEEPDAEGECLCGWKNCQSVTKDLQQYTLCPLQACLPIRICPY